MTERAIELPPLHASVAGPASVDPQQIIITSDANSTLYFIDSKTGATLNTGFLSFGTLVQPMQVRGRTAYCSENGSQGQSVLHAYDLNTGVDQFGSAGIQIQAQIPAAPHLSVAGLLYVASTDGFLWGFDCTNPVQPRALPWSPFSFSSAAVNNVLGLTPTPDGNGLCIITGTGIYGVSTVNKLALLWTAGSGIAFTGAPLLVGTKLIATAGSTVYVYELLSAPVNGGSVNPLWTPVDLGGNIVAGPWVYQFSYFVVGVGTGFQVLNVNTGSVKIAAGSTFGVNAAKSDFAGNVLVAADDVNTVRVFQLNLLFPPSDSPVPPAAAITLLNTVQLTASAAVAPNISLSAAYVIDTSGKISAIELSNTTGATLWSTSFDSTGAGGYAVPAPAVNVQASSAKVAFLLDGPDFYLRLRNCLAAAYFGNYVGASLPAGVPDVKSLLTAVGGAGNSVFVIMWDISILASLENFANTLKQIVKRILKVGALNTNDATRQALQNSPNVQVVLEPYTFNPVNTTGPSHDLLATQLATQHQKISIVSVNGEKVATVSGFNQITPEYFDDPAHPMSSTAQDGTLTLFNYHTWHDTGIVLQGLAADLVEAEFDRRWARQKGAVPVPFSTTYVKVAYWEIRSTSCLDQVCACDPNVNNRCLPTAYNDPRVTTPAVPVEALITNSEYTTPISKIRDRLLDSIAAANSYIFIENYGFHDPDIVMALLAKLQRGPANLVVIVMTPHKTTSDDSSQQLAELYLTRPSLTALLLVAGGWTSFTVQDATGHLTVYLNTEVSNLQVSVGPRGALFGSLTFTDAGSQISVPLLSVTDVQVTYSATSRFIACAPVRYLTSSQLNPAGFNEKYQLPGGWSSRFRRIYVHSKLALMDDQVAFVGSANFTRRSLFYDGEMSLRIADGPTAQTIRQNLFAHWWTALPATTVTAASWGSAVNSFSTSPTPGVGALPLLMSSMIVPDPGFFERIVMSMIDPSEFL